MFVRRGDVLTYGSLFTGIGGIDRGLDEAGWNCRWQVEWDVYCRGVLERHWPDVRRYSDIRRVDPSDLEPVTLIAGGFPCQPVSQAGHKLAQADPRWLWPDFARVVRVLRPRYVLVENVPGLLDRGFGDVLGELAACGYDAEWDSYPAAAVGAPHLRYRVVLVAYPQGEHVEESPLGKAARSILQSGGRFPRSDWSPDQPPLVGVDDGIPDWLDRSRTLGNAVVPQLAAAVGRVIATALSEVA